MTEYRHLDPAAITTLPYATGHNQIIPQLFRPRFIYPLCFASVVGALYVMPRIGETCDYTFTGVARSQVGPSSSLSQAVERFKMDTGIYPRRLKDLMARPDYLSPSHIWLGYLPA